MATEGTLSAILLAIALLPLLRAASRAGSRTVFTVAVVVWLAAPVALWSFSRGWSPPPDGQSVEDRPFEIRGDGFVSSKTCHACHPDEHETWHRSYHRTMTQVATPETVVGNFDAHEVEYYGVRYRLEREGADYWIELDDREWKGEGPAPRIRRRLVITTGLHHFQFYWFPTGKTRKIGLSPLVWITSDQRWVPLSATFLQPPLNSVPKTEGAWNWSCNQCHATGSQPKITGPDQMDTRVGELGIACEACHGPAEDHVRLNRDPRRRYRYHVGDEPDLSIVNPKRLSPDLAAMVCGQCHGIWGFENEENFSAWQDRGHTFRPGDVLEASRIVYQSGNRESRAMQELLQVSPHFLEDRFWSDGMVRVSGREYNGLTMTPCYDHDGPDERKLTCLSCHTMHKSPDDPRSWDEWTDDQLKPKMEGNEACYGCHESVRADLSGHTHHESNSSGSVCYNCHMPYTSYGLLKAIRSHTLDSPTVAASLETGRPNACNQCHLDKTLEWASGHLEEWYGQPQPELSQDERSVAASVLWILRGDAGQRALMAWSLGWEPARAVSKTDWMPPYLAQLMLDPYEAVRYIAHRSLRRSPGYDDLPYDFMASDAGRQAAVQELRRRWRLGGWEDRTTDSELLLDSRGSLRPDVWTRLYEQRDNRRVSLEE